MRAYTGRERGSKKNVILSRPLSLPHSEHPTVCLPWRSSDISRKASGPGNREVSWLRHGLSSTCTYFPGPQSQANCGRVICCTSDYKSEFLSSSLVTQSLVLRLFGLTSACDPPRETVLCPDERGIKTVADWGHLFTKAATTGVCVNCLWWVKD